MSRRGSITQTTEEIAKPLGARASRPQTLENCGMAVPVPGKVPEGFAISSTCIITLLLSLGISICILIASGYDSFGRMNELQDECLNTRVAMNYVAMQIRRFDAKDSIRIDDSPSGTRLSLSEEIDGDIYETRIYLYGGYLRESFVAAESPFNEEYGFEIIPLDSFVLKRESNMMEIELSNGGNRRSMKIAKVSAD